MAVPLLEAALTEVLDFVVPRALLPGSDVSVSVKLRNAGATTGYVFVEIEGNPNDPDTYITVETGTSHPTFVPPGGTIWLNISFRYFKMPEWNFNLTASNEERTSRISRTILAGAPAIMPETVWMLIPAAIGLGLIVTGRL